MPKIVDVTGAALAGGIKELSGFLQTKQAMERQGQEDALKKAQVLAQIEQAKGAAERDRLRIAQEDQRLELGKAGRAQEQARIGLEERRVKLGEDVFEAEREREREQGEALGQMIGGLGGDPDVARRLPPSALPTYVDSLKDARGREAVGGMLGQIRNSIEALGEDGAAMGATGEDPEIVSLTERAELVAKALKDPNLPVEGLLKEAFGIQKEIQQLRMGRVQKQAFVASRTAAVVRYQALVQSLSALGLPPKITNVMVGGYAHAARMAGSATSVEELNEIEDKISGGMFGKAMDPAGQIDVQAAKVAAAPSFDGMSVEDLQADKKAWAGLVHSARSELVEQAKAVGGEAPTDEEVTARAIEMAERGGASTGPRPIAEEDVAGLSAKLDELGKIKFEEFLVKSGIELSMLDRQKIKAYGAKPEAGGAPGREVPREEQVFKRAQAAEGAVRLSFREAYAAGRGLAIETGLALNNSLADVRKMQGRTEAEMANLEVRIAEREEALAEAERLESEGGDLNARLKAAARARELPRMRERMEKLMRAQALFTKILHDRAGKQK